VTDSTSNSCGPGGGRSHAASSIAEALEELSSATEDYDLAKLHAETARREERNALNRLNNAQKKVDEITEAFRKGAPRGSDWNRPSGIGA
jgi:hypothetical protein